MFPEINSFLTSYLPLFLKQWTHETDQRIAYSQRLFNFWPQTVELTMGLVSENHTCSQANEEHIHRQNSVHGEDLNPKPSKYVAVIHEPICHSPKNLKISLYHWLALLFTELTNPSYHLYNELNPTGVKCDMLCRSYTMLRRITQCYAGVTQCYARLHNVTQDYTMLCRSA